MMFGRRTDQEETYRIVDRAIDAGFNSIDTSNSYSRGVSEEFTGNALKRNGQRNRIFLATKVNFPMDDKDPNQQGNSRRFIIEQAEASLRRLKTDYIDLYQIHRPRPDTAIDETLRALDDLVRSGKVRYIGSTTFAAWQVVEALWASKELGLNRFVSEQTPYNLLDRRVERELFPAAQTFGLAILPWSPIGGGILSGKYKRGEVPPEDARFGSNRGNGPIGRRFIESVFDVVEPLQVLANEKGVPLAQLALAWTLLHPAVTSSITGPRTLAHLEDAISALEVRFTEEDIKRIDAIIPPGENVSYFYEANFSRSEYRW
jgi:aryl-alcohol dehydrogenase-like predicted oxidoreductase